MSTHLAAGEHLAALPNSNDDDAAWHSYNACEVGAVRVARARVARAFMRVGTEVRYTTRGRWIRHQ